MGFAAVTILRSKIRSGLTVALQPQV